MLRFVQLFAFVLMTACGSSSTDGTATSPPPPPLTPPAPVASISITAVDTIVFIGDTMSLIATAYDSTGQITTGGAVTWTGGNAAVAVDGGGKVRGLSAGLATIVATSEGFSASKHVRSAYGAALTDLGGTIAVPDLVSLRLGPSSLGGNARVALVSSADPGATVANGASITVFPGTVVSFAQAPAFSYHNFGNSMLTFSYDPAQLPVGVTPLQLVVTQWSRLSVGLLPLGSMVDSVAHTVTLPVFQNADDRYGLGYVPYTPPYVISASPGAITLPRGGSANVTIKLIRQNNSALLTLQASNTPEGLAVSLSPISTTGASSTLSVSAQSPLAVGVYPITISLASPFNPATQTTVVLTVTP